MLPDAVLRVATLTSRPVRVVTEGKEYVLPAVPEPPPIDPPNPLLVASKELLERDAASRAFFESVGKNWEQAFARVDSGINAVAAGQEKMVESVSKLEGTLHLPVKPVYDKSGKLVGAQRVKGG